MSRLECAMTDSSRTYNSPDSLNRSYAGKGVTEQRRRTLATLAPAPGERILDVGCGSGFLSAELANAVGADGRIVAVDHNPDMVEATRKRCRSLPQVVASEQDVTALEFEDGSFDAVTCNQVLLYVPEVQQAIREMIRVLRPGGRLAILETDWRTGVIHSEDPELSETILRAWDQVVASPNLPVRLRRLMIDAGLSMEQVEAIPMLETDYDPDDFLASSLEWIAMAGVKNGDIDQQTADRWVDGVHALGRQDAWFSCVNRFLFCGRKPSRTRGDG